MSFILLGVLNSQVSAVGGTSYDLLETVELASSASSISFTGLGSYTDYKHLQIRAVVQETDANDRINNFSGSFNGDTGTNYTLHALLGNGSTVSSFSSTGNPFLGFAESSATQYTTGNFAATVIDILDFSDTNKYKTVRHMTGSAGSTNAIVLESNLWLNTSAITQIEFESSFAGVRDFATGTRFSLYGIKGA